MKRSILDKLYLVFLLILLVSFVIIIVVMSVTTRATITKEKTNNLIAETEMVASQTVGGYVAGDYGKNELARSLSYYSTLFGADFWYINPDGDIVAVSSYSPVKNSAGSYILGGNATTTDAASDKNAVSFDISKLPSNIYDLDQDYRLSSNFNMTNDFYGLYSSDVITINMPLTLYSSDKDKVGISAGTLICHSSVVSTSTLVSDLYRVTLFPCLFIIVAAFTLLMILSRNIVSPVVRLTEAANEYSTGNFDVKTGINTTDEFGQLAKSMEYMASELSQQEKYRHDFISNISHDFRSPLTSIKGYVEAMLDGTIPPDKYDRYLRIVLDETQRLTKLTQGLLDLNNMEMYGTYLTLSNFDVAKLINPMMNTFEMKCIDKNIAIYFNNHSSDTVVTADKTKIQQVIYNLIDNAIKFTPEGKRIFITLTDAGPKVVVSVKDEGIGMDEETQKKIWGRFYKGDQSRGKDKQGSGLGLAIIREIIKAHNESIEVISAPGEGSEFIFTLIKESAVKTPTQTLRSE